MNRVIPVLCTLLLLQSWVAAQDTKKSEAKPSDRPGVNAEAIVNSILERMDTNKDGKISKAEARNRIADNFDAFDSNKDGFLDRKELLAMAQRLGPMMPGRPGRPNGFGPGGFVNRIDPLDFDALDKNADGRLTRDELKGTRFAEQFEAIDKNKDGKIDPSEWAAYHKIKK